MTQTTDDLLSSLGQPGRYQVVVCFLMCLNSCMYVFNHLSMTFFGAQPLSYRCGTDTFDPIAFTDNTTSEMESCQIYENHREWCSIRENCSACSYDEHYIMEDGESTIVSEFNLVCGREYLASMASSLYYIGLMLGGLLYGHLSDSVGRFPTMLTSLYGSIGLGIGLFFVKDFVWIVAIRCAIGFMSQGLQVITIVSVMERVSSRYHATATFSLMVFWSVGSMALALIAYLVRDWRWMQLWSSALGLVSLVYIWFIPESMRWLIVKGKFERVEKQVKLIIRFNGITSAEETILKHLDCTTITQTETEATWKEVLKHKKILLRTAVLSYAWLSIGMVYYGLVLSTGTLHGSKYINYFIGSGVEFIAMMTPFIIPERVGRKKAVFGFCFLGGTACIVAGNITDSVTRTGLAFFGRFCMSGVYSICFLFSSELFPTTFRAVGLGVCGFWAGVGAVLAPQLNLLGITINKSLPTTLFGSLVVAAAILVLILPETSENETPDTLEDIEAIEHVSQWTCCCRKNKTEQS